MEVGDLGIDRGAGLWQSLRTADRFPHDRLGGEIAAAAEAAAAGLWKLRRAAAGLWQQVRSLHLPSYIFIAPRGLACMTQGPAILVVCSLGWMCCPFAGGTAATWGGASWDSGIKD